MSVLTNLVTTGSYGGKPIVSYTTGQTGLYSGVQLPEGFGAKWYLFQCIGGATVTTITLFGTTDPNAVIISPYVGGLAVNGSYPAPGSAGGYWFQLFSPAQQGSTDNVNPFTKADGSQYLYISGYSLRAVCAVSGGTQTGTSTVIALAGF